MNDNSPPSVRYAGAPTFFIIGGAKCGTTTLYHLLKQVDDVFLTERKEPRFFGNIASFERGIEWYLDEHFRSAAPFKARGEATPQYLHGGGGVAERIRSSLGEDLKFIVLLRDPVWRAWSHYLHMRRLGTEELRFREALAAERCRLEENPESWFGYFSDGLYASRLREWLQIFPRERYLILLTDQLRQDPRGVVDTVCDFLGVDEPSKLELCVDANSAASAKSRVLATLLNRPNAVTNLLKLAVPFTLRQGLRDGFNAWNRISYDASPSMPVDLERRLRSGFADDLKELENITGYDLSDWYR